jgi:hypothetical protein
MTMAAPHGNDATLTAAAGCLRLRRQWWRQKQWGDNDRDDRQQRLQVAAVMMVGADNNQQEAAVGVAKTADVVAAGAERQQLWQLWQLKCGGGGGNDIDNGRDR